MVLNEPTYQKEIKYQGKIFSVEQHQVILPDGRMGTRDVIQHNGAVAIIPLTNHDEIILVRQYRKGIEKAILEIPAGMLDKENEQPLQAAQRELREETQYEADDWQELVTMSMSPGYLSEYITVFVAKGLKITQEEAHLDEDEFVDVVVLNRQQVEKYLQSGEICDAKTLYAIMYWDLLRERGEL